MAWNYLQQSTPMPDRKEWHPNLLRQIPVQGYKNHLFQSSPQALDVERKLGLTPQERRIVEYHRDTIRAGRVGRDPNGRPVTVYSTGIRIPPGEPNAGKFVAVPGYDSATGKIMSEREAYDRWRDEIRAGLWPLYDSGDALNARSGAIHQIMDLEGN